LWGRTCPGGAETDIVVAIRVRVAGVVAVRHTQVSRIVVPITATNAL